MPISCQGARESLGAHRRPALVVGHPGHELKVFGWMSEYTPRVYVITDGSGRTGISRVTSTAALIARAGAQPGEILGFVSDAGIYRAILNRDFTLFLKLVDVVAESLAKNNIDSVVGDACEGFNPTHDLCRAIINAAVLVAQRLTSRTIANFEFCLTEWEKNCPEQPHDGRCVHWILDRRLLAAKLEAADQYVELRDEVRRALALRGEEYFRVECMKPVQASAAAGWDSSKPPYETWGEQRVAEGEYQSVIRFKDHISPIMHAILEYAEVSPSRP